MLRSKDVIGATVVTEDTGEEVGSVKDVIVHRSRKCVIGFLVRRPGWFQYLSVLPFADVVSFDDSVVAREKDSLLSFSKAPDAVRHMERKPLPGTTLITTKGHELGQIVDFSFDEASGDLKGLDVFLESNRNDESSPTYLTLDDGYFIGQYDVVTSDQAVYQSMPETQEFSCFDSPTVDAKSEVDRRFPVSPLKPAAAADPAAISSAGVLAEAYRIKGDEKSLTVTFDDLAGLDDLCVARLREKLLKMRTGNGNDTTLRFDVTQLKLLPSVMLGLLSSLRRQFGTLEIINPSKDSADVIKMMGFDKLFKIRNQPSQ